MLSAILWAAPLVPQIQFDHRVNGVLNGDFETLDTNGRTADDPNQFDGAFWMGAEDRTVLSGANRVLQLLAGQRVLQRVGSAQDQTDSLVIHTDVFVPTPQDQVEITIFDGPVEISTMKWFMATGNSDNGSWSFSEVDPATGNLVAMTPNSAGTRYTGTLDPDNRFQHGKNTSFVWVDDVPLLTAWKAPRSGRVRAMWRSTFHPRQSGSNAADIQLTLAVNSGGVWSPTVLETSVVENADTGGPVLIAEFDVAMNDEVAFQLGVDPAEIGKPRSRAYLSPTVTYVDRRLTYVVGDPSMSVPASTPEHSYRRLNLAPGEFGSWKTLGPINAGSDFTADFGGAGNEPRSAVVLELAAAGNNSSALQLDDVVVDVTWRSRSEADLRRRIISEGQWVRDNAKTATPGVEVPYDCDFLYLDGHREPITFGNFPIFLEETLEARFDRSDFELMNFIREQELRLPLSAPAGLRYVKYRCEDPFSVPGVSRWEAIDCTLGNSVGVVGELSRLIEGYRKSGDPSYLDIGYNYAQALARLGVVDITPADGALYTKYGDNCDGLLYVGSYDLCTGKPTYTNPTLEGFLVDKVYEFASGASTLIRFYGEARAFNEAQPAGSSARYNPLVLDFLLTVAETGLDTAIQVRNNNVNDPGYPSPDNWGFNWLAAHGGFNDLYGYQSNQARRTYTLLQEKSFGQAGGDPRVLFLIDKLRFDATGPDILYDGAQHFYEFWTQIARRSGYGAADQGRAYPAYLSWVLDLTNPLGERQAFLEALVEQASVATKLISSRQGAWVNSSSDWFELPDFGNGNGAGTGVGPPDHWLGVQLQAYSGASALGTQAQRDDLIAQTNTMLEETRRVFSTPFGYFLNFQWIDDVASGVTTPADYPAGAERRPVETMLRYASALDGSLSEEPSVDVKPQSFALTSPSTNFTIEVNHPGSAQPAVDLQNQTFVYLWREDSTGDWERLEIWPNAPGGVTWNPIFVAIGSTTASVSLNSVPAGFFGQGDVKITAVTYDGDKQWSWDTSMQEW